MVPDLGVDPDPRWIQINAILIPALLGVIPDPAKNGIVTQLAPLAMYLSGIKDQCVSFQHQLAFTCSPVDDVAFLFIIDCTAFLTLK